LLLSTHTGLYSFICLLFPCNQVNIASEVCYCPYTYGNTALFVCYLPYTQGIQLYLFVIFHTPR
jgi:hypothetical protein